MDRFSGGGYSGAFSAIQPLVPSAKQLSVIRSLSQHSVSHTAVAASHELTTWCSGYVPFQGMLRDKIPDRVAPPDSY